MAATTKSDEENTNTKSTSSGVRQQRKATEDAPREELTGVLRTSRIGPIEWRGSTSGSTPEELAERRWERLDEAKKPGDEGYNAYTDPLVPSSTLADVITAELAGDSTDSPTWNSLNEAVQMDREEHDALKKFREERAKKRAS